MMSILLYADSRPEIAWPWTELSSVPNVRLSHYAKYIIVEFRSSPYPMTVHLALFPTQASPWNSPWKFRAGWVFLGGKTRRYERVRGFRFSLITLNVWGMYGRGEFDFASLANDKGSNTICHELHTYEFKTLVKDVSQPWIQYAITSLAGQSNGR